MVSKKGKETLVCESIDNFHGLIFCKLLNQNFSSKIREVKYKLVEIDYEMNKLTLKDETQLTFDEYLNEDVDLQG